MKEFKIGKFTVRFRPAPTNLKAVLVVLVLVSAATLLALHWVHTGIQDQTRVKREQAARIEGEKQNLQEKIENIGSVQGIRQIARDELGLADPDTVLIHPE